MRVIVVVLAVAACGGTQKQIDSEREAFQCKERSASYTAIKSIAGDEIGYLIDCAEAGPRIKRWRTDKNGKHEEDARAITPGEFDRTWREIAGTGWENLKDCTNGTLDKRDPVYHFEVKDDQNSSSFECQTREVPYPYNDISNALDLAANQGRKQLGDDEPADAKALDHKDKQR